MDYDLGHADEPRGHAFLYFRSASEPGQIAASYLVVPPIALDLKKYIPPMFAGSLPGLDLDQLTRAVPLPPIPETVESYEGLRRLAELRGDDLIAGGTIDPRPDQMMFRVAELAEAYAAAYRERVAREPVEAAPQLELSVEDVLYELMNETDRLQELVKLAGKLRYGVEVDDRDAIVEAERQIQSLSRYFPASYRAEQLVAAIRRRTPDGARLAELYVQRMFKLQQQRYDELIDIENEIRELEARATNE